MKQQTYPVKLTVICDDRAGMLKEFTAIISDDGTNIRSVDSKAVDGWDGGGGLCGGDGGCAAPEQAGAESAARFRGCGTCSGCRRFSLVTVLSVANCPGFGV